LLQGNLLPVSHEARVALTHKEASPVPEMPGRHRARAPHASPSRTFLPSATGRGKSYKGLAKTARPAGHLAAGGPAGHLAAGGPAGVTDGTVDAATVRLFETGGRHEHRVG